MSAQQAPIGVKKYSLRGPYFSLIFGPAMLVLIVVTASIYIFSPQLSAGFWLLDDHQIMDFLNQYDRSFSEYIVYLTSSSSYDFSGEGRSRPVYAFLRTTEAYLWGDNPMHWYAARLLTFILYVSMIVVAVFRVSNFPVALAAFFLLIIDSGYQGVFTRLGPGEAYASVGIGLMFLVLSSIAISIKDQQTPSLRSLVLLGIAVVITVGSKESLIAFALFLIPLFCYNLKTFRARIPAYIFSLGSAAFTLYLLTGMYSLMKKGNGYVGDQDIPSMITALLKSCLDVVVQMGPILAGVSLISLLTAGGIVVYQRKWIPSFIFGIFVSISLFLVIASQYVFYAASDWPLQSYYHYNFPGVTLFSVLMILNMIVLKNVLSLSSSKSLNALAGIMCIAFSAHQFHQEKGFESIKNNVSKNIARTQRTTDSISRLLSALRSHHNVYLIIEASNVHRSYEPSHSVSSFIRNKFGDIPIYLRVRIDPDEERSSSARLQHLAKTFQNISRQGKKDFKPIHLLEGVPKSRSCVSVYFNDAPDSHCELVKVKW